MGPRRSGDVRKATGSGPYRKSAANKQVFYCEDCADRYKWPKDRPTMRTYDMECTVCGDCDDDVIMYAAEWNPDKGMIVEKAEEAKTPGKSSIRERVQQRVERDHRTHG